MCSPSLDGSLRTVLNVNLIPCSQALRERLPYFKALSAGALILQGAFDDTRSPFHAAPTDELRTPVAQIQHLLTESSKMGE